MSDGAATVRAFYDAYNRGAVDEAVALYEPDARHVEVAQGRVAAGRDADRVLRAEISRGFGFEFFDNLAEDEMLRLQNFVDRLLHFFADRLILGFEVDDGDCGHTVPQLGVSG